MKRKLAALAVVAFALLAPSHAVRAATVVPLRAVELQIVHAFRGCHVWHTDHDLGPATTFRLRAGGKITLRVSCPMDFTIVQLRGPALALGDPTFHTGTSRTFVFKAKGTYVVQATNIQSSAEMGLQTLGTDNVLRLTVVVS